MSERKGREGSGGEGKGGEKRGGKQMKAMSRSNKYLWHGSRKNDLSFTMNTCATLHSTSQVCL